MQRLRCSIEQALDRVRSGSHGSALVLHELQQDVGNSQCMQAPCLLTDGSPGWCVHG